jgi:hypothetical protein
MPRTRMDSLAETLNDNEVIETEKPKTKKKFEQTDYIMCRSVVTGGLYLEGSKTKQVYAWTEYGDETEIEYRDLVAEVRQRSEFVFGPRFIVENEDFIEEFPQLKQFYNQYYSVKELGDILELPVNQMAKKIEELPKGAKESIRTLAASKISTGSIDSVAKIKKLDEIFDTDLEMLSSLVK